jgi:SAM-dependent methyltransferase
MAQDYFEPVAGGILLDVSCGSGLFTRKFAKSRTYSAVIALDFSENMLRQCYGFTEQDDALLKCVSSPSCFSIFFTELSLT